MPQYRASTVTGTVDSLVGGRPLQGDATACELLAGALACCIRDSLTPLLERHDAPAIGIEVRIETGEAAQVLLGPEPGETALRQKLERAMLRCPVALQLKSPPRIEWHS
ncbi:MAG: hypothetical protein R3270_02305 [Gammaproteobacteria bacterium]|nr:hypothetical protein [Gammaproteobacteria bacterium]